MQQKCTLSLSILACTWVEFFKQLIELTGQRIDGRITDWVEYRREGGGKTLEMLMTYAALMHGL